MHTVCLYSSCTSNTIASCPLQPNQTYANHAPYAFADCVFIPELGLYANIGYYPEASVILKLHTASDCSGPNVALTDPYCSGGYCATTCVADYACMSFWGASACTSLINITSWACNVCVKDPYSAYWTKTDCETLLTGLYFDNICTSLSGYISQGICYGLAGLRHSWDLCPAPAPAPLPAPAPAPLPAPAPASSNICIQCFCSESDCQNNTRLLRQLTVAPEECAEFPCDFSAESVTNPAHYWRCGQTNCTTFYDSNCTSPFIEFPRYFTTTSVRGGECFNINLVDGGAAYNGNCTPAVTVPNCLPPSPSPSPTPTPPPQCIEGGCVSARNGTCISESACAAKNYTFPLSTATTGTSGLCQYVSTSTECGCCYEVRACCHPEDGSCTEESVVECGAYVVPGIWQGPGTNCTPNMCPQPAPLPSPAPAPAPLPAPAPPTYCLREFDAGGCGGTLLQNVTLAVGACTQITLLSPAYQSVFTATPTQLWTGIACNGSIQQTLAYGTCLTYSQVTGSFVITSQNCNIPLPAPAPAAPAPVAAPAPATDNCLYYFVAGSCAGNASVWFPMPCNAICTAVGSGRYASLTCGSNVTAIYSDAGCSSFLTSSSNGACGVLTGPPDYTSFITTFGTPCPPPPPAAPAAPAPAPAPPAGPFCVTNYNQAFCGGTPSQYLGTCQTCDQDIFFIDCNAGDIHRRPGPNCAGSNIQTWNFGDCLLLANNISASRSYTQTACPPLPPPPPPPPVPNVTCARFYLSTTCTGLTVEEPTPGYCFNSSFPALGPNFFTLGPSLYRSFYFNCQTSIAFWFQTSDCSGPDAQAPIGNPGCFSWDSGNFKVQMSSNASVCGPCSRTENTIAALLTLLCFYDSNHQLLPRRLRTTARCSTTTSIAMERKFSRPV